MKGQNEMIGCEVRDEESEKINLQYNLLNQFISIQLSHQTNKHNKHNKQTQTTQTTQTMTSTTSSLASALQLTLKKSWKCYNGVVNKYVHQSAVTNTPMTFCVYLPPATQQQPQQRVPVCICVYLCVSVLGCVGLCWVVLGCDWIWFWGFTSLK